jgi:uncharacterized damage-inducible protein DinB
MTELERIHDQLKRAFEGDAWHGPSVREILAGITATQAAKRPIAGAHTIWEIVLHMTTWEDAVRRRALGEKVNVTPEQDWPGVTDSSESAWKAAIAGLEKGHAELRRTIGSLAESRLTEPLVPGGNNGYIQLHGIVQHDLYHAGQIALLKKS